MGNVVALPAAPIGRPLDELERVIERGVGAFAEVGRALAEIKEGKRYRERGFSTFEEYVAAKWGLGRRRAYQLIDASSAVENVKNFSQKLPTPTTESHAAILSKLDTEQQPQAWRDCVEVAGDGPLTAEIVKSVVVKYLPPKEPDPFHFLTESGRLRERIWERINTAIDSWPSEALFHIPDVLRDIARDFERKYPCS